VIKTTVYLPAELKSRLARAARRERRTEAELIRTAIEALVGAEAPRPTLPLFDGEPIADFDAALRGFGER